MNTTARHIAHLLPYVSALEVEGLGIFGRVVVPASYSVHTHRALPPYESIGFEMVTTGCGTSETLVRSLMLAEGLSREQAQARIVDDVAEMREVLCTQGRVALGGSGFLVAKAPGMVEFESAPGYLGSTAGVWLPELQLHPLNEESAAVPAAGVEQPEVVGAHDGKRVFGRGLRIASSWAAAIVIFGVVAFVSAMVNRWGDGSDVHMASTMGQPMSVSAPAAVTAPEQPLMLVFVTPADGVDDARVRPDRVPATTDAAATQAAAPAAENSAEGPYFLIVASLANMEEAQTFVDTHSDSQCPLEVQPMQGRFRVSALSGSQISSVMEQGRANGVFNRYPNAWVCRR